MIFRLCDRNSNDKISIEEWETFKELFINPYESSCSKTPDYLISESSIAECLNLPVFDIIPKSTSDIENIKELILDALNRADEKKLNFADYIFLRRASFAWKECSVDGKLNKKRMECGLTATTPQKRRFLPISNQVFNIAIQLYQTEKLEQEAFLNFFPFLNIAYMYYFFNEFELPFQDEYLSKKTILKGVEDQILPTSFTAEIVNDIYNSIDGDNLDFMGFASLSYCHKKYKKYLEKDEGKNFSEQSFKNLLKDKELKNLNQIYFDNVKIIDENEYKEFLEINKGGETKLSDKDYFGRFKKINSKNLLKIARMRSNNKINVIFSIFDVNNDKNLKFFYFALFMKLSWAFRGMDTNVDGFINGDHIKIYQKKRNSLIPFTNEEKFRLNDIIGITKKNLMNIKEFYTFFTYDKIISKLLIPETINLISYSNLKNIFDKVGLFLSNSTMRFSKELAQNSNLASYNYEKAFKRAIKEEIIIIKILKFKNDDKMVSKNERDIELNMKSYKKYFDKEMKEDINLRLIG